MSDWQPVDDWQPVNTSAMRLPRQAAAGVLDIANFPFQVAGLLGWDAASRQAQRNEDYINDLVGVQSPRFSDDPLALAARVGGGAIVGVPRAGMAALGLLRPVANPGVRVLEAITPVTLPLTPANVAINTAAGTGIAAGVQAIQEAAERDDRAGLLATTALTPPPAQDWQPVQAASNDWQPVQQGERTWAQVARDNAPLALLGALGGGAGLAAVRQMRVNRAADAALQAEGGYVNPAQPAADVYRPGIGEATATGVLDQAMPVREALRRAESEGIITGAQRADVEGGINVNLNAAPRQDRVSHAYETGDFLDTGIRVTPGQQYEIELAQMRAGDPITHALYQSARTAADELDMRNLYATRGQYMTGVTRGNGMPEPARRFHADKSYDELEALVTRARSNPTVAQWMARDQADNLALRQLYVREGLITAAEANKMGSMHPNYLHTLDPDNSPLTRRNMAGYREPTSVPDVTIARRDAMEEVLGAILENRTRREIARVAEQILMRNAHAPREYGIARVGDAATLRKDTRQGVYQLVTFRDKGQRMAMEVTPELAKAMNMGTRATLGALTTVAQATRSMITGRLAALAGYIHAPTSALYGGFAGAFTRPVGTSMGYMDRLFYRIGLTNGSPIPDPTVYAAMARAGVGDLTAEGARAFASSIERSIIQDGKLAAAMRMSGMNPQQIADRFTRYYMQSRLYNMRMWGSANSGLSADPNIAETMQLNRMALTPEYRRMLPASQQAMGAEKLMQYAVSTGNAITPAAAQHAWRLFGNVLNIISDTPASAFVMLNQGRMSDQALHGTARRLAGDPATRGGNQYVQQATSVMNYANVSMQSQHAWARAFREQPVRTMTGLAVVTSAIAATTLLSAIEAGPEHVAHLLNSNGRDTATGGTVYIPGMRPEHGLRIVVDPTIAPFMAAANGLLPLLAGIDPNNLNGTQLEALRENLSQFLSDRFLNTLRTGAEVGLNVLATPPGLSAASQLVGGPDLGELSNNINPRVGAVQRDRGVPGYEDTRTHQATVPNWLDVIMRDLGGITGEQLVLFLNRAGYDGDVNAGIRAVQAEAAARNRIAAPLLQPERVQAQRGAVGEVLAPIEGNAGRIAQGFNPSVMRPGAVGSGRAMMAGQGGTPTPVPEDIVPVLNAVRRVYNATEQLRSQRSAFQQQIVRLQSHSPADEAANRQAINEQVDSIRQINARLYNTWQQVERELQRTTGRRIQLERIDPLRGLDQFDAIQ